MNEVRGKIVLLNRIDDSLDFGAPVSIPHNVAGTYLADSVNRQYRVYVQDKCRTLFARLHTFGGQNVQIQLFHGRSQKTGK